MLTSAIWCFCGWCVLSDGAAERDPIFLTFVRVACAVGAAVLVTINLNGGGA